MNKNRNSTSQLQGTDNSVSKEAAVDELTRRNVEMIRQLEESAKDERKPSDLVAEAIANFCGSMTFVWVHVIWFGVWILVNSIPGIRHLDSFPFTFLTLVVSLEAIFLSTFILISQNHDTRITERRNHLDLQINLLSEQENTKMIGILQAIADKVGADTGQDPHVQALSQETELGRLAAQIEEHESK
jgi:uncharacterized membrane protein